MNDKNIQDSISVISFIIVLLFLFFAAFLITVKTKQKTRNRLLAFFLIITAIDISVFFYYRYLEFPPEIEMIRARCISFLKSPLLFLYVLSLIYTEFRLKWKHLLHALPFLLSIVILLPNFFIKDINAQKYFLAHFSEMKETKFLFVIINIQSLIYIIANLLMLRKYRTLLFENYTSNISYTNYKWLSQLIYVIITLNVITMAKDLLKYTFYYNITNALTVIMLIGGLIFIFWLVLNALYYPDLFRGIDSKLQAVEKLLHEAEEKETYHKGPSQENEEKIQKLKAYMDLEEPYLEPSLTIQDLAGKMAIPVRDLSILINHQLDQHFFDFINEYRIEKAMKILKDPKRKEFTVLEILYEVGFNSKSSFNTAFKKRTGLTPTQYRKEQ